MRAELARTNGHVTNVSSVWKPLQGPVRDWPLAICDATTQDDADLQEGDIVFSDRVIENYLLRSNPNQRWYYISDQMPDEAWVFLQSDTEENGLCGEYILA